MTFERWIAISGVCLAAACGGGGSEPESELKFLKAAPTEDVLCSFVVGKTTEDEVLRVLGEPTNYSADSLGSLLQYWVGSLAEVGSSGVRAVNLSFDDTGTLDMASVDQIPYPQCWRSRAETRDAAERAGSSL